MAKGPFMEFLRGKVAQTVVNTYAELQIPTPTSKTENMAMLIHSIELEPALMAQSLPTTGDSVHVHLSSKSRTASGEMDEPDVLAARSSFTILNAVFHAVLVKGLEKNTFDPPILYPKANLYAGINTTTFAAITNLKFRIGYTLEKVSREDFISALVE